MKRMQYHPPLALASVKTSGGMHCHDLFSVAQAQANGASQRIRGYVIFIIHQC